MIDNDEHCILQIGMLVCLLFGCKQGTKDPHQEERPSALSKTWSSLQTSLSQSVITVCDCVSGWGGKLTVTDMTELNYSTQ